MTRIATSAVTQHLDTSGKGIQFAAGLGAMVTDVNGRSYTDFVCGFGPVVIGHADSAWNTRLAGQLGAGVHLPGYARAHEDYAADFLGGLGDTHSVAYFKHSSDAVSAAIRLSAVRTGRSSFIRCGYIGWHDAQIANSPRWHEPLISPLRPIVRYSDGFRGVSGSEKPYDWVDLDLATLGSELLSDQYACLVVDAYQAALCPPGTLEAAVEICRQRGVLVVLDETKTAGRVSPLGHLQDMHEDADYIVCGKAVANGVALSLLVGTSDMPATFGAARVSGTFSKDLMSVYAAIATREVFAARGGYEELSRIGNRVVDTINMAAKSADISNILTATSVFGGALWDFVWVDELLGEHALRESIRHHLADAGLLVLQGHPSFIMLAHDQLDLSQLHDQFETGFRAWQTVHQSQLGNLS